MMPASADEARKSAIKSAREIIGPPAPDDYLLRPKEHAALFATSAPALAELLALERLSGIAKQYASRDAQAVAAQDKFKRGTTIANLAVLAAAIAGALMMAAQILSTTPQ